MWQYLHLFLPRLLHFYSHIPCGMWRDSLHLFVSLDVEFLLTHPVWDVTKGCPLWCKNLKFLLTHPVWDVTYAKQRKKDEIDFYSHIPCGMWLVLLAPLCSFWGFLLTHPVWDVTLCGSGRLLCKGYFYSHIPCGMWRIKALIEFGNVNFYSHIPCGMWHT